MLRGVACPSDRAVTAVSFADTGHFPMFERTAPQSRVTVARWLGQHGF
jgi:hypothetical protein